MEKATTQITVIERDSGCNYKLHKMFNIYGVNYSDKLNQIEQGGDQEVI